MDSYGRSRISPDAAPLAPCVNGTQANFHGREEVIWGSRGWTPVVSTGVLTREGERGGPHPHSRLLPRLPDRFLPAPPPAPHRPTAGRAVAPRLLRRRDR